MFRLLTRCPERGDVVATHAVMPRRAFLKLKSEVMFFCSSCRGAHAVDRSKLWLDEPPPAEPDVKLS